MAKRYIDADLLVEKLEQHFDVMRDEDGKLLYSDHVCTGEDCDDLLKLVNALPTVDIEEVVYCKECKYCVLMDDEKTLACVRQSAYKKPTDFCSRGKRKEAE